MNRNVNVFIAVVLCMGLCGGLIWLHTANDGNLGWNIQDFYEGASDSSLGAAYTNATFSGSADGGSLSMPVMSSRGLRRSATSHVGVYSQPIANSQSPLTSSPATAGGAMYATSSQTYKSFGGGMYAGASQVSNSRSANSPSPIANGSAGLSVSPISYTSLRGTSNNPQEVLSNADIAAVMSASASMTGSSMFGSYVDFDANSYVGTYKPYAGTFGGKRAIPTIHGQYQGWLDDAKSKGDASYDYGYDQYELWDLFESYFPPGSFDNDGEQWAAWIAFLSWFMTTYPEKGEGNENPGSWYFVPVSDAVPCLLLLSALWGIVLFLRRRKVKVASSLE